LKRLTGERWVVAVGRGPALQTLAEQARAWRERRLRELATEPCLQRLLAQFPGARIVDVEPARARPGTNEPERKDDG
jgi:DNA polymerase-3 subunit gamma/tau